MVDVVVVEEEDDVDEVDETPGRVVGAAGADVVDTPVGDEHAATNISRATGQALTGGTYRDLALYTRRVWYPCGSEHACNSHS